MGHILFWSFVSAGIVALFLAGKNAANLKSKDQSPWQVMKQNAWQRPVILTTVIVMASILALPMFTYIFAYGFSGIVWDGLDAAGEYSLLSLPAIAGIVAGVGFVWGRDEGEVVNDKNVVFYMWSIVILIGAHVVYLGMHFRPFVVSISGFAVSISAVIFLWRRPRQNQPSQDRHAFFSLYELGYAMVMIAPPFLLLILISAWIAYAKGQF